MYELLFCQGAKLCYRMLSELETIGFQIQGGAVGTILLSY